MIKGIQKSKFGIITYIILLVFLALMAGIGFLMKYVLLPGIQRNSKYGADINLEFLGMDRHQWGTIHLITSKIFITLIILHIILHWDMIICILDKMIQRKLVRSWFLAILAIITLTQFINTFLASPALVSYENNYRNTAERVESEPNGMDPLHKTANVEAKKPIPDQSKTSRHSRAKEEYGVHGIQTINGVSVQFTIPAGFIGKELKISEGNQYQPLVRLRKGYGFTMSEVGNAIAKIQEFSGGTIKHLNHEPK